jgi:hypothetical protein
MVHRAKVALSVDRAPNEWQSVIGATFRRIVPSVTSVTHWTIALREDSGVL